MTVPPEKWPRVLLAALLPGLMTLAALSLAAHEPVPVLNPAALLPALSLVWGFTLLAAAPRLKEQVAAPFRRLRTHPALLWLAALVYLLAALAGLNLLSEVGRYQHSTASAEIFYAGLALWLLALFLGFGLTRAEFRDILDRLRRRRLTGGLLSVSALVLMFTAADLGARLVLAQSDGFGFTLMATNWLRQHWEPVNALGYRDAPLDESLPDGVRRVIVAGDSLAAGYGVARLEDTFPHILGDKLGAGYAVNVVAQPGWATEDVLAALKAYPVTPDVLVVSHYVDDSRVTAHRLGLRHPIMPYPGAPSGWLIASYQVPNYIYWHVYAPRSYLPGFRDQYRQFVEASYTTPAVWSAYETTLMQLVEYSRTAHARLVVLVWPDLLAVEESAVFTRPVADFFERQGATVISMTEVLTPLAPEQRYANPLDFHPNAAVHHLAAEQVYAALAAGEP